MAMTRSFENMLVHVGLHKTGTTWLQKQVLAKGHTAQFWHCDDRPLMRSALVLPSYVFFDPDAAREAFSPVISEATEAELPLVLSDEMLAGIPFHNRFGQGLVMERVKAVFPGAKILITIREHVGLIHSAYGHYLRAGHTGSLEDFLAMPEASQGKLFRSILDWGHYDYAKVLAFAERMFGQGEVMLAPMEWMTRDTPEFLARMETFTGYAWPSYSQDAARRKVNAAWTEPARRFVRHANRLESKDARWRHKKGRWSANNMASRVSRWTPRKFQERMKATALDYIRSEVGNYYAASNQEVAQRIGVDLGKYGYTL